MKKRYVLGVSVTLALATTGWVEANANPGSDDCANPQHLSIDEQTVCSRFHDMVDAAMRHDADAVLSYFQSGGFSAALTGRLHTELAPWAREYRDGLASVAQFESMGFPEIRIRTVAPDTIILLNTYQHRFTLQDGSPHQQAGYGSQTWVRHADGWRIVHIAGE